MSKFPNTGTSIFTVMSKMANDYNAINLSQGFPNFPVDENLKSILAKWAISDNHQYMPMSGFPPLLEKIAKLTEKSYGRNVNPSTEILITAGATEGIFASIQALVEPGKEVIILEPAYDCYETPVVLTGAKPVYVALKDDFTPNWELIRQKTTENTVMLLINNPHNPAGRVWTESDFEALEKLTNDFPNLLLLSDEVYEYIAFEQPHISVHQREKLRNKSISISSFGKSFHITGWKIGYVIAPEPLMHEIKKVHQFLVFSVNSVAQAALNDYLETADLLGLKAFYQEKRDFFRNLMRQTRLELAPCEGSYFQLASYNQISDENDLDFTKRLVTEFGVAAIPLSPFFHDKKQTGYIRFCFAKDNTTLATAVERLMLV